MHWREVIRRPIVTEKSNFSADVLNQFTFVVHSEANKSQIREAVELAWPSVTVEKIRVMNMPAKRGRKQRSRGLRIRKAGWKKAVITLSPGDSIDLFEGV